MTFADGSQHRTQHRHGFARAHDDGERVRLARQRRGLFPGEARCRASLRRDGRAISASPIWARNSSCAAMRAGCEVARGAGPRAVRCARCAASLAIGAADAGRCRNRHGEHDVRHAGNPAQALANELGWRHGVLVFNNTTLADAAARIQSLQPRRNSSSPIRQRRSCTIDGTFPHQRCRGLHRVAQTVLGLHVANDGDEIVISR